MGNHRFGLCRSKATINLPASSACNDSAENWADARVPSCFKAQKSSRTARSRRHGLSSRDLGQVIFPGCAARAALKATLEKGPTERWIIGSNDVAAIIDNRSHRHRPKDAGENVILTNALDRCVAWSNDLAPSNYPATRVQHYRPATYCPGGTHESSQARSAWNPGTSCL